MAAWRQTRPSCTGENEWFTPAQYIEAARLVLEEIDLDPASNEIAQRTIKAAKFFTIKDDGLKQPWAGRVWLNPPYSQPQIGEFVGKLVGEYASRSVTAAILLTHNYTDTAWFHTAERPAALVCFTRGRIKFVDSDGLECAPTQGQAFFYFGDAAEKFRSASLGSYGESSIGTNVDLSAQRQTASPGETDWRQCKQPRRNKYNGAYSSKGLR